MLLSGLALASVSSPLLTEGGLSNNVSVMSPNQNISLGSLGQNVSVNASDLPENISLPEGINRSDLPENFSVNGSDLNLSGVDGNISGNLSDNVSGDFSGNLSAPEGNSSQGETNRTGDVEGPDINGSSEINGSVSDQVGEGLLAALGKMFSDLIGQNGDQNSGDDQREQREDDGSNTGKESDSSGDEEQTENRSSSEESSRNDSTPESPQENSTKQGSDEGSFSKYREILAGTAALLMLAGAVILIRKSDRNLREILEEFYERARRFIYSIPDLAARSVVGAVAKVYSAFQKLGNEIIRLLESPFVYLRERAGRIVEASRELRQKISMVLSTGMLETLKRKVYGEEETYEGVDLVWNEFKSDLEREDFSTSTPGEVGDYAVNVENLPEDDVSEIVEAFRESNYTFEGYQGSLEELEKALERVREVNRDEDN
jgi:hypothetical protein